MKKMIAILTLFFVVFMGTGTADTFTHKTKDVVYHGFMMQAVKDGKNIIQTQEKGPVEVNAAEYDVVYDTTGRNNFVSALSIIDAIETDYETQAFEEAIAEEADKGPLFILIEIDSPGGRVSLCKRLCAAITHLHTCPTDC